jgi:glutamate/tyrosine decarboxylase-like PLP-dependent enzyme
VLFRDEQARRQAFSLTLAYLAELIEAASELELAAPVPLDVVCFRYVNTRLDDAVLD